MKKVIEVNNLVKEYKHITAVDNLSFDTYEGFLVLMEVVRQLP